MRLFILEVKACLIETMKDVIMVYNRTKKEGFLPVNIKKTSNVAGEIGIKASSGKGFNVTGILSEVTGMKKVTIARISDKKKPGKCTIGLQQSCDTEKIATLHIEKYETAHNLLSYIRCRTYMCLLSHRVSHSYLGPLHFTSKIWI